MFAARALRVRSWAGANLLGGGDGEALADPGRARSRRSTPRARILDEILGYAVEAPVRIDCVRDLGEWKTAWDHVSVRGLPRRADEAPVHLGGVRLRARRAAGARPRAARRARARARATPASSASCVLLQGPGGHGRARARPAVRDAASAGRSRRSPREALRPRRPSPSSSAFPPCSRSPATSWSAPRPRAGAATCRARPGSPPPRRASTSPGWRSTTTPTARSTRSSGRAARSRRAA